MESPLQVAATSPQASVPARPPDPCLLVLFGATGDLAHRKIVPALFALHRNAELPSPFGVLGTSTSVKDAQSYRAELRQSLERFEGHAFDAAAWDAFASSIDTVAGDYTKPEAFRSLRAAIEAAEAKRATAKSRLFYLAVPPAQFPPSRKGLSEAGLTRQAGGAWRRVIIEKPFGHDLDSARLLSAEIGAVLQEPQIYRIDHYLGKETVQNILVFRFANGLFEPIWNRNYIDHVQITVSEELGVEGRGPYYDTAGAMRDMVPNHIAQLVSLVGMEPPISFSADAVRDEQVKLLNSIEPLTPEEVLQQAVRGQYGPGDVDGKKVPGYREEEKVPPESNTETFVALRLLVDNWRWAGVPFYARTGKRLPKRVTQIVIQFKHAPAMLFQHTSVDRLTTNRLYIHIQPKEGISLRFGAKVPGPVLTMGAVEMDFDYVDYFGKVPSTGYETLLYDAMIGDATLFQRADMVEAGWSMVQPVLDVWKALPARSFPNYAAGSWGPPEADELLRRDGRHWENSGT